MPRSGINGTYTLPGTQASVVPGTTISSSVNNQGYSDIEQTFNTIQPEAYGGTGASTYAQARTNLGVLSGPVSAMSSRRNLWVNGSFKDSQENGNTLGTTNGYYPADQVSLFFAAAGAAMSVQRIQVRTLANATDQIEFKTTTIKASLAATDFVTLTQNIEGSSFAESGFGTANAKPYVHRLQVSLPAGLYHMHYSNSAANRHCAVPFTIAGGEANTAVIREIVVPADTGGTWLTADGVIGITAELVLAAGSSRTGGTASTWSASTFYAASTQFNILSSTANVARLADVGMKIDPDATGVYGAYAVGEVDGVYRSERYWWARYGNVGDGFITNAGATLRRLIIFWPMRMTKSPAVNFTASLPSTFTQNISNQSAEIYVNAGDATTSVAFANVSANARLS